MRTTSSQKRARAYLVSLANLGLLLADIANAQQAPPAPTNNVRPAMKWKRFDYTCDAGDKITVYLHNTTVKVRTHDHIYMMRQTPSADGNRYSDGKVVWWSKGETGFLQEDTPDGDGKPLVKGCVLDKPADAAKP